MNILKKSLVSIFGSGLLGFINLIIGIVLARCFGPAGVGQYQLVVSTALIFAALITLGVGEAVIYYINNKRKNKTEVTTLSLKFSCVISLVAFVFFMILFHYKAYFGQITEWAIISVSLYGAMLVIVSILWPILLVDFRIIEYQTVSLAPRFILLILVLFNVLLGSLNINTAWLFTGIGQFTAVFLSIWFLRKSINFKISFNPGLLKSLAGYGMKINLSYIIRLLNGEMAILFIRILLIDSFTEIGYYSRAMKVLSLLLFFASAVGALLYVKWSSVDMAEKRLQVESVSRVFLALAVPVALLLIVFAPQVITLLYGEKFLPAVIIMRILSIGIIARLVLMVQFRLFSSSGKPLYTTIVQSINLVTLLALMFFWVPTCFSIGAAWAFSIGNLTGLAIGCYLSSQKFGIRLNHCLFITRADIKYLYRALKF